jgi:hypothetical protein
MRIQVMANNYRIFHRFDRGLDRCGHNNNSLWPVRNNARGLLVIAEHGLAWTRREKHTDAHGPLRYWPSKPPITSSPIASHCLTLTTQSSAKPHINTIAPLPNTPSFPPLLSLPTSLSTLITKSNALGDKHRVRRCVSRRCCSFNTTTNNHTHTTWSSRCKRLDLVAMAVARK